MIAKIKALIEETGHGSSVSREEFFERLEAILTAARPATKVFVAIRPENGKLVSSVISTVPVTVVSVLEAPESEWNVSNPRFVEKSRVEVVDQPDNFREAVFDTLAVHVESGQISPQILEKLSRSLTD